MKEYPIPFNDEMVRAILAGQKTQTRRPIVPQPKWGNRPSLCDDDGTWALLSEIGWGGDFACNEIGRCPYGVPGDRLQVNEAFDLLLEVTDVQVERVQDIWTVHKDSLDPWCDIFAEGIPQEAVWDGAGAMPTPLSLFIQLWNAIYAKRGLSWDASPWVWVLCFKRLKPEEVGG